MKLKLNIDITADILRQCNAILLIIDENAYEVRRGDSDLWTYQNEDAGIDFDHLDDVELAEGIHEVWEYARYRKSVQRIGKRREGK